MAEAPEPNPREAGRWRAQAAHDLDDAAFALAGGRHALACFLAQQAAEKAVAAYLYARGADAVWGHALADLCEDAMAFDASFDLIKSVAVLLDKYHTVTRYPSALPGGVPWEAFGRDDAERALAVAREVVDFAAARADELQR